MNQSPVKKSSYIVALKDIQSEDIAYVPKNIGLLNSVSSVLSPTCQLAPVLVIKSTLFQELFFGAHSSDANQEIKEFIRRLNGAEGTTKKRLLGALQQKILKVSFSKKMEKEILSSYKKFVGNGPKQVVKFSPFIFCEGFTLPVHLDQYFTLKKDTDILKAIKQSLCVYFSPQVEHEVQHIGYDYISLNISVVIEKALPAQVHGILTTFETSSQFENIIEIHSGYGKSSVKNKQAQSDIFLVSKPALQKNKQALFSRTLGEKSFQMMLGKNGEMTKINVPVQERNTFSLSPAEVVLLADVGTLIQKKFGHCVVEWEKIGTKFILQNIETIHIAPEYFSQETYLLQSKTKPLVSATGVGKKIGVGKIHVVDKPKDVASVQSGDVLWVKSEVLGLSNCLRVCSGLLISEEQKETSVVREARELSIPVVFLPENAFKLLKNGKRVTVCQGAVYEGTLPFEVKKEVQSKPVKTKTKIMMNIENPFNAFELRKKYSDGVGMVRMDSLFVHAAPIHPFALLQYPAIRDKKLKRSIEQLTRGYSSPQEWALEKLCSALSTVALAFAPHVVTVALSDFLGKDISRLLGAGEYKKHNAQLFEQAFALQCKALHQVRDQMDCTNLVVMAPLCATPALAEEMLTTLKKYGLERGKNGLQVYARCEGPENFILAKEFAKIFDGLSLSTDGLESVLQKTKQGSRTSKNKAAIKAFIHEAVEVAHKQKKQVSFSTTALDEAKEFSEFLIQQQIESLSFSPDTVLEMKQHAYLLEKTVGRTGNRTHKGFLSMVVGMGAVAATLIGMGSGCSTNFENRVQKVKEVGEYIPPAKIREELQKNIQRQVDKLTDGKRMTIVESGFADFVFDYPISWKMNHGKESILLVGATSTEYVNFSLANESLFDTQTTSTIAIVDGRQSVRVDEFVFEGEKVAHRVEVPMSQNKIFVIQGQGSEFESILNSVKFSSRN